MLAIKSMGGESAEAWRTVLDDLIKRELRRPEFLIVDGAPGLDKAIATVWDGIPLQRCTVHKHRNLFAHAPERLHDEITADYNDMIYAATREEIETRRKAFIRKWRLKHRAVADSLEEAGDRLFTFAQLPPSQWRSVRTTDEIDKSFLLRDLLFWRGTGDRVAKSRARGCQPGRAAVTVAPHWRHPCAAYQDHAAAIG
jgi:transposase-like protein